MRSGIRTHGFTVLQTVTLDRSVILTLFGRGTENRTLVNRLKAYYFTTKLYPHNLGIPLGTRTPTNGFGDRYAAVKHQRDIQIFLAPPERIELPPQGS